MTKVLSYCVLHNRVCKRILNVREWFLAGRGFHIMHLNSDNLSRNLSGLASVMYSLCTPCVNVFLKSLYCRVIIRF